MIYIDIHTHQKTNTDGVFSIYNVIAGRDKLPENQFFSIGVHPWYLNSAYLGIVNKNISNPNCLAIGECGMDALPQSTEKYALELQERVFTAQIHLAEKHRKPLIIHCVKCYDKLLHLKKQYQPLMPWIIHGYTKNKELALQMINAGFYLSFGAGILRSKTNQEALKSLPLNRFFLETDMAQNSINEIYETAASLLSLKVSDLQLQIQSNFMHVFEK